jgi:oligosaccharide repeat unit polymerase
VTDVTGGRGHPGFRPVRRAGLLRIAFIALALAVGSVVGYTLWGTRSDISWRFALIVLGLACAAPVIIAVLLRRFDPFEPSYAFLLSTFIYFVFIPAVLQAQDAFSFLGINYSGELTRVTTLAFLALVGFLAGYYYLGARKDDPVQHARLEMREAERKALRRVVAGMLVVFALLLILWVRVAEIPLSALWIFGDASYGDAWDMAAGPQIGYLYGVREALPACLILLLGLRSRRRWPFLVLAMFAFTLVFFAGSGARFRVLLLVLSFGVYFFLERGIRPKLIHMLLASLALFYFVVGGIGFYRSDTEFAGGLRGRSVAQDVLTMNDAWDVMLDSSQISVSTALLIRVVPAYQPYFNGASFLNAFTQPIPRFLWPEKPVTIGEDFFAQLWPPGTTVPFWALFYLNFGPIGVIPGMMAWGWFSRLIYDAYRRRPWDPIYQTQLAVYWPFVIHMYGRGGDNFAFNLYGLITVLLPVWIVILARKQIATRAASHPPSAARPQEVAR